MKKIVVIGSDHAGYEMKRSVKAWLREQDFDVIDVGTRSEKPVDYPDYAEKVADEVLRRHTRGILICGSGVGASIAANKIPGIRAGLCHDSYSAHQGVEHDDMNVLVLGSRVISLCLAQDLVSLFLAARFSGESRHIRRLEKLIDLERKEIAA